MRIRRSVGFITAVFLCFALLFGSLPAASAAGTVDYGLPVLTVSIDETAEGYGTIAQMNESPDHSAKCAGTIRLDVPENYKGDYSDSALVDTEKIQLDYIRGRGNTTWAEDKKPYKLKLKNKANLLGMGSNKHWVLLSNAKDDTLLRNRIISYIGSRMGLSYTPKMLPVDVVMNGEHLGSYFLAEHVRVGKTRVNIDELTDKDVSEPEITGGYLFKLPDALESAEEIFTTEKGASFVFDTPAFYSDDPDDELGAAEQKAYITDYLQKIENAVYGKDFKDESGASVWDYMDMRSTADYWVVQEFSCNVDAVRTGSTFLYKPRNGKVFWGPLWDFDLALGNTIKETSGFHHSKFLWLDKLRDECPEYQKTLRESCAKLSEIITDIIKTGGVLDKYASEIKSSWEADQKIWNEDMEGESFESVIGTLRGWLKSRQSWINKNADSKLNKVYGTVSFVANGKTVEEQTVLLGKTVLSIPKAPEKKGYIFDDWMNEDGTPFERGYSITDDTTITAAYINEKDIVKAQNIFFQTYEAWDAINIYPLYLTMFTLTPYETNDKVMSWSSSDTDIAEVDTQGVVTKKKTGTVTITAELRTGLKKSYTLHIYDALETPIVEAESIKAEKSSITLKEGEYGQVRVTTSPQPCYAYIYYSSSKESVAEVDDKGVIHALKEGATTITASIDAGKPVKYKVTVKSGKKANTVKAKAKTKSLKAKDLKKKAQTVKPLTISKAKGKVTVKTTKVMPGKKKISAKKFRFTKKGRLTVAKGSYKKGAYKLSVKITAKGTEKYKPKTLRKTVSIKIK